MINNVKLNIYLMSLELLVFLILFPFLIAFCLLAVKDDRFRRILVTAGSLITIISSIAVLVMWLNGGKIGLSIDYQLGLEPIGTILLVLELIMGAYILYASIKAKKLLLVGVTVVQLICILFVETLLANTTSDIGNLIIDELSIIMVLIVGIIGGLICIYALGYMKDYHSHHPEYKDRRAWFFFLFFIFLGAMYGLVLSNSLMLLFFFWEITSLCSFFLIGYSGEKEATNNAFRALLYNQIGSFGFIAAIIYLLITDPTGSSATLSTLTAGGALMLIPAALIGFAGLSKSAQFPFSSWLVGAMVAPTPVSALLHSSTMVKAGVYVILRCAPVYAGELTGMMIALAGGFTFLIASAIAISESNAKKVLAYSTIANLGLIVTCAGIGTPGAIWAAIFLIIFHAVAKSLLFLSVGTVEHRIGSRDIEDMTALIIRMPKIGIVILIGIAGMFLAPFGMLISKWASIHAFAEALPPYGMILVVILAYGSGLTVFFWAKWMGKILAIRSSDALDPVPVERHEGAALFPLAGLTVLTCFIFPLISSVLVEPYILGITGSKESFLSVSTIGIMLLMMVVIISLPLAVQRIGRPERFSDPYLGGIPVAPGPSYSGSLAIQELTLSNYYLKNWFGEEIMTRYGVVISIILIIALLIAAGGVI